MKRLLAIALLAVPLSFTFAEANDRDRGRNDDRGSDRGRDDRGDKGKGGDKDKGPAAVAAPEIDAAAGTLAIALAGGGMALLARSRRKRV